jgi:hypothetical protein
VQWTRFNVAALYRQQTRKLAGMRSHQRGSWTSTNDLDQVGILRDKRQGISIEQNRRSRLQHFLK